MLGKECLPSASLLQIPLGKGAWHWPVRPWPMKSSQGQWRIGWMEYAVAWTKDLVRDWKWLRLKTSLERNVHTFRIATTYVGLRLRSNNFSIRSMPSRLLAPPKQNKWRLRLSKDMPVPSRAIPSGFSSEALGQRHGLSHSRPSRHPVPKTGNTTTRIELCRRYYLFWSSGLSRF